LLPLGGLVVPVAVLAVLAALDRAGGDVRDPMPRWIVGDGDAGGGVTASIADALADPQPAAAATVGALLQHLTARTFPAAICELVTAPLAVDGGFALDAAGIGLARADALGPVLRAWLRLMTGEREPALDHPSPAMVRRAWAAASRLVSPDGDGAPAWHGPGFVRNVGAVLATGASPLAFGRIESGAAASGLAVCDPCAGSVIVVLQPPGDGAGGGAAGLRARADALLAGHR
jgi:hypothetical protein